MNSSSFMSKYALLSLIIKNSFFFAGVVQLQHPAYRNKPVLEAVILKIKPEAKLLGEFPEKIWYEATIPGSARGCYRGYVQMLLGWLAGDFLYKPSPDQPINIMLWGPWDLESLLSSTALRHYSRVDKKYNDL